MGVVGPEYEFIFADVGMNGRMSDGGNWATNQFHTALENVENPLSIPKLEGRLPYHMCVLVMMLSR